MTIACLLRNTLQAARMAVREQAAGGGVDRGRRGSGAAGDALPAVVRHRAPRPGGLPYGPGRWASGWDALGWLVIVVALAAIGCAAWLAIANATGGPVAQSVAASVLTATAGTLAFVALALRALVFQPGPNDLIVLRYGAWLGLLAAVVLAVGGWRAIKDERTDAPESAYTPPEPRPAPPRLD